MATLNIEGRRVTVDDGFLKLSPEQQDATVNEIASSFKNTGASSVEDGRVNTVTVNKPPPVGVAEDMAKSAGIGVVKGAIGTAAAGGDIRELVSAGVDYAGQKLGLDPEKVKLFKDAYYEFSKLQPGPVGLVANSPTSAQVRKGIEAQTGEFYKPQTTAGEYAQTVGEFAPAALSGPAGVVRRGAQVAVPALASETAGQATKGTAIEPYARFGAALAGGVGAGLATRPGTASRSIREQMPEGVTPQMVDQAEALMQDAAQRGIQLAWPEAISQVAGRPVLTNMMRHLEASPQTEGRMAEFFGQRPQQVEQAARQQFDQIAPINNAPSGIGPAVGGAAEDIATQIRAAINTATRPMYDAAGQHLVPRQVHAAMVSDPRFAQALDRVRNDADLNSFVRGHSDRSVAVYDAVKKELEQRAQNAAQPLNPNASQAVASSAGTMADTARDVAIASERASARGPSSYEAALATQARFREQYLTPFLNSPLGRAAGRETTTQKAIDVLFPSQPLANSEQEIGQAVRALSNRNPRTAQDLVRAHVEGTFNQAARDLQTGANQAGGAKFRAQLIGNPQQAANLEAAVTALPNGQQRWEGFNRFLEILEATGTRQNVGSRTAYNVEINKAQGMGGVTRDVAKVGLNPMKALQPLVDRYDQWKLGRNLGQLARILTDPGSANQLRAIARMPQGTPAAANMALKLITYGEASK